MERYKGVRGGARVKRISDAIEECGARILSAPDPGVAPFEYRIHTTEGEDLDLICYAFTANKYRQGGRPTDEHRFQVKYGSDFYRTHELFIDPTRKKITLMFGVHEEMEIFVAVDPMMHRITWFSSSVEFKDHELAATLKEGWHGWERERVSHGRRRVDPREDLRVEAMLGLVSKQFMRYVQFERVATGLDPGERLAFIDSQAKQLRGRRARPASAAAMAAHPLEQQLGLSANEILEVIQGRGRLLTAVLGGVAEQHLEKYLREESLLVDIQRLDQDGPPDFTVRYRGRPKVIRVECKNVRGRLSRQGPWVDFQKTRAAKGNPCSRYYATSQFEVLAACLHPITMRWEFRFVATSVLPEHRKCPGKLSERIVVDQFWPARLPELLDRMDS